VVVVVELLIITQEAPVVLEVVALATAHGDWEQPIKVVLEAVVAVVGKVAVVAVLAQWDQMETV
jgi:hypothetical protein